MTVRQSGAVFVVVFVDLTEQWRAVRHHSVLRTSAASCSLAQLLRVPLWTKGLVRHDHTQAQGRCQIRLVQRQKQPATNHSHKSGTR